jgi:hypothetical protein
MRTSPGAGSCPPTLRQKQAKDGAPEIIASIQKAEPLGGPPAVADAAPAQH